MRRLWQAVCVTAMLFCMGGLARAQGGTFNAQDGTLSVSDAAFSWGMDSNLAGLIASDAQNNTVLASVITAAYVTPDAGAFEGTKALALGTGVETVSFRIPTNQFAGKRVEFTFWQHPENLTAKGSLAWVGGVNQVDGGSLSFVPTGRATSDGWYEVTSGPVDYSLGGQATIFPIVTIAVARPTAAAFSKTGTGRVLVDAFAIDDLGSAAVPNQRCNASTETGCGAAGVCQYGHCVDAATVYGSLPPDGVRQDYVARRAFEMTTFDGNRSTLAGLAEFQSFMAVAKNATTARDFWTSLRLAYQALGDGHVTPPNGGSDYWTKPGLGLCLHLGSADVSGAGESTPLVYDVDASLSSKLSRGDALVSIDGLSVADWRAAAARTLPYYGDPASRVPLTTSILAQAALTYGSQLSFRHCPGGVCDPTLVVVDAYAAFGSYFWKEKTGSVTPNMFSTTCDYRVERAGSTSAPPTGGTAGVSYVTTSDEADMRTILFNSFTANSGTWYQTMSAAVVGNTTPLILIDQRLGSGGTPAALEVVTAPFFQTNDDFAIEIVPALGGASYDTYRERFVACASPLAFGSQPLSCGGFMYYKPGKVLSAYANLGSQVDKRVAILIGDDVSANDLATRIFTLRDPSKTRLFGAFPTRGGFGYVDSLPPYIGEKGINNLQVADSVFYPGTTFPSTYAFGAGHGVTPTTDSSSMTQLVVQKQSDLLNGIDTQVAAAKAWLRGTP